MKELKNIIICPNCESLNLKRDLKEDEIAVCAQCGKFLYKRDKFIEIKLFSLILSGIIFFIISMFFPAVKINIVGYEESLKIFQSIFFLFNKGYVFISIFVFFTVFLFPFMCLVLYLMASVLFFFRYHKKLLKRILILITAIKSWCFLDIFFIAILVSLVKVLSYASIKFDIGFIAYIIFLSIMFYIVKILGVKTLWEMYENI